MLPVVALTRAVPLTLAEWRNRSQRLDVVAPFVQNREFIQNVQYNMLQIVEFLNKFGTAR
jgi:hypothetical protein